MAVNLITGEIIMGLDPQLMNLSPQLAAPSGNKINQVNNFLRSDYYCYYYLLNQIYINEYFEYIININEYIFKAFAR